MKQILSIAVLTLVVSAAAVAQHSGKAKPGQKKAMCSVCVIKEGSKKPEPVNATVNYRKKLFNFCSKGCKAEFISTPGKYAKAVK
jgi:YHS domain-containing protein